jgi:hypothetical protein
VVAAAHPNFEQLMTVDTWDTTAVRVHGDLALSERKYSPIASSGALQPRAPAQTAELDPLLTDLRARPHRPGGQGGPHKKRAAEDTRYEIQ